MSIRLVFASLSIFSFHFGYTTLDISFSTKAVKITPLQEPLELNLHSRDGEGQFKVLKYRRMHDTESAYPLGLVAKLDVNSSRVASEESRVYFIHKLVFS